MSTHWLADRTRLFDSSGIRKVFDLGAKLKNPIDLSIGQPNFDVPEPVRRAAIAAIESRKNGYALSQGMPVLRDKLQARIDAQYGHDDREVFVASGTSGGLMLALLVLVNPGEEVIVFDPLFVMYDSLSKVIGGKAVYVDTYPDFRLDLNRVADAITPRTKAIIFNSPSNPTGVVDDEETVRDLAELAARRNVAIISDEIYAGFCYDRPYVSPAKYNPQTIVVDGFGKTYGMPGWRLGFAHGPGGRHPRDDQVAAVQFHLCAASVSMGGRRGDGRRYVAADRCLPPQTRHARGRLADDYEFAPPGGAFYMFPKTPWGTGMDFVARAIEKYQLLIIPGNVFSRRDTHFRISYATDDRVLERGIEALRKLVHDS